MRTRLVRFALALLVASLGCLFGCPPKHVAEPAVAPEYDAALPPGKLALRKITNPAEIPDFTAACGNPGGLAKSIDYSIEYMLKPSSPRFFPYGEITHKQALDSLRAFRAMLDQNMPAPAFNAAIREKFDVYVSVGYDNRGSVLFTGYYTPIFNASPVRTEKFRYPLYKAPADLKRGPEGTIVGRVGADGQISKYPSRMEIERSNMLAGNELFWLADPFEVYIAHVQGSAQLRMSDGSMVIVGYTANNGHDYTSVGRILQAEGKLPKTGLSLQAMIAYFHAHPDQVQQYTWRNPRYVFFSVTEGMPRGSLNEPVTPWRTIATDKSVFPRACLAFVDASFPRPTASGVQMLPYRSFLLDQDTGGAIRAAGRADVYVGIGDKAGELAGRAGEDSKGKLYYLFLKPGQATPPDLPPVHSPMAPAPASPGVEGGRGPAAAPATPTSNAPAELKEETRTLPG